MELTCRQGSSNFLLVHHCSLDSDNINKLIHRLCFLILDNSNSTEQYKCLKQSERILLHSIYLGKNAR